MARTPDSGMTERYRQAAEEALDQLDWCIEYLYRIRKNAEARGLAANRRVIRQVMRGGSSRG